MFVLLLWMWAVRERMRFWFRSSRFSPFLIYSARFQLVEYTTRWIMDIIESYEPRGSSLFKWWELTPSLHSPFSFVTPISSLTINWRHYHPRSANCLDWLCSMFAFSHCSKEERWNESFLSHFLSKKIRSVRISWRVCRKRFISWPISLYSTFVFIFAFFSSFLSPCS